MRLSSLQPKQCIFESVGGKDAYFETWKRDIHPVLCEVALSPEQIDQLFKSVEKGAGRSALGRGVDAVKAGADKISDVWFNKFGGMLQSSDIVQGFDAKWEQIKSDIAKENPKLADTLSKYKTFADKNPKTQKFLLAIAASAAAALGVAVAGGVGASALAVGTGAGIATGIVNIADRLLKNEKFSTAVGRGATAGIVAGVTAGVLAKAKSALDTLGATKIVGGDISMVNHNGQVFYLKPEDMQAYQQGVKASQSIIRNADIHDLGAAMDASFKADAANWAKTLAKIGSESYQQQAIAQLGTVTEIPPGALGQAANAVSSLIKAVGPVISAVTGQAAAGAGQKKESRQYKGTRLNEQQLNELFGITGNKVDAASLMKAWKKAGSPTDSDAVAKLLTDAGVDNKLVTSTFKDMGVEVNVSTGDTKVEPKMDTLDSTPAPTDKKEPTMADPTTTTDTKTDASTADGSQNTQVQGNLDLSGLAKLLPSLGKNPTPFKAAVNALKANKPLTPVMKAALGNAFMDMIALDPGATGQVSNMLKKVSAK